jgi:hypothetical protein
VRRFNASARYQSPASRHWTARILSQCSPSFGGLVPVPGAREQLHRAFAVIAELHQNLPVHTNADGELCVRHAIELLSHVSQFWGVTY